MVVNVSWPPIWCAQYGVQRTNDVDEGVAHEEEEIHDRCNAVHSTHQNAQFGNERSHD